MSAPSPKHAAWVDSVMEQAQVYASSWSLVGGRFDAGDMHAYAVEQKEVLRAMLIAGPVDPIPTGEAQESDFGAFEDAQGKQG